MEDFGYNNVGFPSWSLIYCTMDFDGPITKRSKFERNSKKRRNRIVYKNLNIEILYPTKEELERSDLQK